MTAAHHDPGTTVLRAADLPVTRPGGWATRELASGDGWSLSLRDVERPGALPAAAGAERVLTVVDGELLVVSAGGGELALERHRPGRTAGDVPLPAALPTGPVRVLDVLAHRDAVRAHVVVLELSKQRPHPVFADQLAVLLTGRAAVAAGGRRTELAVYDAVRGTEPESPELTGRGFVAVVSLDPVAGPVTPT
ncbi:HutD family protein [Kocuria sp.]|uniref:HutD family protein n=1 Tax=Kocuria sp. TaxID=1871328 RepID=UPI00281191E3|nr:HutD family protein [Kocuria sp.]